jgi:epoxyqueuosine reductase
LPHGEAGAPSVIHFGPKRCIAYLLSRLTVRRPVSSGITKRGRRHTSQEVCPHNHSKFVQITSEEAFWPRQGVHGAELIELMGMDQAEFSRRFKNSPVKRAKRRGLLRNVAVAVGNWGSPQAVPVLTQSLWDDEPLIRGHAAWALGRIGAEGASQALRGRLEVEEDAWVREELELALAL